MDIKTYNKLIINFRAKGDDQANKKRIEYTESRGNADVLANFKATGDDLNLDPLQVLGIFMKKHWSSIINYIKTGKVYSDESIHGRIMDLIQYLELTHACILEKQGNGELEPVSDRPEDRMTYINKHTIKKQLEEK